jgi:hypothetical protein
MVSRPVRPLKGSKSETHIFNFNKKNRIKV